jgi:hypothetical protein
MADANQGPDGQGDLPALAGYEDALRDIVGLLEQARAAAGRSVNAIMTATYWGIGRRIVEQEQGGQERAAYGEALLGRLSADLTARFGRGFSARNLRQFRQFYLTWPPEQIWQTSSAKSPALSKAGTATQVPAVRSELANLASALPLPWSAYVRLMSVKNEHARRFYETEALRSGWTVRQLDRQIGSMFYERTALSKDKAAMLAQSADGHTATRKTRRLPPRRSKTRSCWSSSA